MFVLGFDVEQIALALVLFAIIFCFECWLITPTASAIDSDRVVTEESQNIPI